MNFPKWIASMVASLLVLVSVKAAEPVFDLVVYGGTSAAVTSAVQAKRMGKSVIIVCPDQHLGGLTSGGLGWTDTGNKAVIGGLSREFYHRVWQQYQKNDVWRWQKREEYGNKGQGTPAIDGAQRTMWIFEPHVAETVFDEWIAELDIPVHRNEWLDRNVATSVVKEGARIQSIRMLSGKTYRGRMFIDATYEGDLLATSGVDYHVGRESTDTYDEQWNGVQTGVLHHGHHFGAVKKPLSPYQIPGDPSSGVLPRVSSEPPGDYGAGDHRIQAYCFRMCLTAHPENRIPFPKPEGYDPGQYELLLRIFDAGWRQTFNKFDPIPNHKTDTNNHGPFSTDNIGFNYDYPEGSYERRREIIREHEQYQKGLMYFIANDPRVPEDVRSKMARYGLAKDEFKDNGGWPHQIYVREARRMVGDFVMTENELLKRRPTPRSVGMGSYTMDSHNVQRYIMPDGFVQNEGDIGVSTQGPYEISYGSLIPKKEQCDNLLVPVCVSSSHIAFGSIRMEPVFMILGQSAATAAMMCLESQSQLPVQDLPYDRLRERLLEDGQVLEIATQIQSGATQLEGIVVDDFAAIRSRGWRMSHSVQPFYERGYHHDNNENKGNESAQFETELKPGIYEVRMTYTPNPNRATNVPVEVHHASGVARVTVNQREKPEIEGVAVSLGSYTFDNQGKVSIGNGGTDGYVILDAVQWIRQKEK